MRSRQRRRNKKRDKSQSQRIHAKQRALERYDLDLNRQDLEEIIKKIHLNKASFIKRQSFRVTVWKVTYKEKELITVYDKHRQTIATFLPPGLSDDDVPNQRL